MLRKVLLICAMLVVANAAFASSRAQVEIIIFEQIKKANEEKRRYPGDISAQGAIEYYGDESSKRRNNIRVLELSEYKLKEQRNILGRHKDYRVLQHVAWEQDFDNYSKDEIYVAPDDINSISFSSLGALVKVRPYQNNIIAEIDALATIVGNEYASRIKSRKVIGNKQVYYFDHPDFGVIIQVRKI
jgi:hypothetical protein